MSTQHAFYRKMLAGAMICEISDPSGFRLLQDSEFYGAFSEWAAAAGYEIRSIGEDTLYFLVESGEQSRARALQNLREATATHIPVAQVFEALIRVVGDDSVYSVGYVLDKDVLLQAINQNDTQRKSLEAAVRSASRTRKQTNADLITVALHTLTTSGYLVCEDDERETYRVTGKILLLMEMMSFISDYEQLDIGEEIEPGIDMDAQESLL